MTAQPARRDRRVHPSPPTREQLLEAHAAARRRRNAAALGSEAYKEAVAEVERMEVEIARIEREADPPRM